MPSQRLFGRQWHLAADAVPLLDAAVLLPTCVFLVAYAVILPLTHSRPHCDAKQARMRDAVVWGTLAFAIAHAISSAAVMAVGLRGAPLETAKRRWMEPLLYVKISLWLLWIAFAVFSLAVIHNIQHACWPPRLRELEAAALWTSIGVYLAVFLTFAFTYNALAGAPPHQRWRSRITAWARRLGCYHVLMSAQGDTGPEPESEASGDAPLEELAASFARFFGSMDLEKTDVVAGMVLAHTQQRRQAIAARLQEHGIDVRQPRDQRQAEEQPHRQPQRASEPPALDGSSPGPSSLPRRQKLLPVDSQQAAPTPPASAAAASGTLAAAGEQAGAEPDERFHAWMRDVSAGCCQQQCLTPSRWGAELAPQLSPQQAAEIYTGCKEYVQPEALLEAQRWANFAIAAFGSSGFLWQRPKTFFFLTASYWRARAALKRHAAPAHEVTAAALPPVRQKLQAHPQYVRHYVAAQKVAGLSHSDFIYTSFANAALGATPYNITLHRASRTVVLAIRGSHSFEDALTDMMDRPVDITAWLPEGLRQAHPTLGAVKAHWGMYSAAKAVLQDLNDHQILPILLTGAPLPTEEQRRQHAAHAPDAAQLSWERLRRQSSVTNPAAALRRQSWAGQLSYLSTLSAEPGSPTAAPPAPPPSWAPDLEQGARAAGGASQLGGPAGAAGTARGGGGGGGSDGSGGGAASESAATLERQLSPADYQRLLRERGADCRGWRLVVTGHSLGAAVAALVGMHLLSWCPGVKVWAFCPPGGMCTPNLASALEGCVTSVAVGKDAISRLGTVTLERLLDQMVLALARTRLPKLRVLCALRSAALRERPHAAVFRPLAEIPPEALRAVRGYWESKARYASLLEPMFPPGRLMLLRRLKTCSSSGGGQRGTTQQRQDGSSGGCGGCSSCCGDGSGCAECWDAVWVQRERLLEEGILLSPHQASDHYTARLTQVLSQLTGRPTTARQADLEGDDDSCSPAAAQGRPP